MSEPLEVVYAEIDGRALALDVYAPDAPASGRAMGPRPALLCIHGGGWKNGNKRDSALNAEYARLAAARGLVAFALNYRLSDVAPYPAQIDDVETALAWVRQNAAAYGVDPERIGALGCSAGGHLASLLAVRLAAARRRPGTGGGLRGVVSICGPQDLARLYATATPDVPPLLRAFLGGTPEEAPGRYAEASPLAQVSAACPPFLFVHGDDDDMVPIEQAETMQTTLAAAGVSARLIRVQNGWHDPFHSRSGRPVSPGRAAVNAEILDFLLKVL